MKKVVILIPIFIFSYFISSAQSIMENSGFARVLTIQIFNDSTSTPIIKYTDDLILMDAVNNLLKQIPAQGNMNKDFPNSTKKTKLVYWNPYKKSDTLVFYNNALRAPKLSSSSFYGGDEHKETVRLYDMIQNSLMGKNYTLHENHYSKVLDYILQLPNLKMVLNDSVTIQPTNEKRQIKNGLDIKINKAIYTLYPYKQFDNYLAMVKSDLESNYVNEYFTVPQAQTKTTIAIIKNLFQNIIENYWSVDLLFNKDTISKKIPDSLINDYSNFVLEVTTDRSNETKIKEYILAQSIAITTGKLPENNSCGNELNLPFMKNGFDPKVYYSKLSEDNTTCMLRTNTTALWFVLVQNNWRLYRLVHKPSN